MEEISRATQEYIAKSVYDKDVETLKEKIQQKEKRIQELEVQLANANIEIDRLNTIIYTRSN